MSKIDYEVVFFVCFFGGFCYNNRKEFLTIGSEMQIFEKAKITDKNQLTIPKRVREQLGVGKGDYVSFYIGDDGLVKVSNPDNLEIKPKEPIKQGTIKKENK